METRKKKLVISTGAGISAESGMATYRDAGGLWDNYPVMQVASADGFEQDPALIHRFYSNLRKKLADIKPNAAHYGLKDLEKYFDVRIITQNVDDLHERAGSSSVLHLHGELMKVRSMTHPERVYDLTGGDLETSLDTRDKYGDPVRPHIVFFQEDVPNFSPAVDLVAEADIFVVIGTSLVVYPAAALINYVRRDVPIYYIDPRPASVSSRVHVIAEKATTGVETLKKLLLGSE
ncbi:MAG: SIR2 family NAD-dependent protein deacylase [Muribaculaceae bacterium]